MVRGMGNRPEFLAKPKPVALSKFRSLTLLDSALPGTFRTGVGFKTEERPRLQNLQRLLQVIHNGPV